MSVQCELEQVWWDTQQLELIIQFPDTGKGSGFSFYWSAVTPSSV